MQCWFTIFKSKKINRFTTMQRAIIKECLCNHFAVYSCWFISVSVKINETCFDMCTFYKYVSGCPYIQYWLAMLRQLIYLFKVQTKCIYIFSSKQGMHLINFSMQFVVAKYQWLQSLNKLFKQQNNVIWF